MLMSQTDAILLCATLPLHTAALTWETDSQQAARHCSCTYGDVLFTQLCSDPATKHCNKVQGKMQIPLFSAALQNRLFAGLCHCNDTHGHLLFTQMCNDPTAMHCNTGQGNLHSPVLSAALENRLTAGLYHNKCDLQTSTTSRNLKTQTCESIR